MSTATHAVYTSNSPKGNKLFEHRDPACQRDCGAFALSSVKVPLPRTREM